MAGWGIAEWYGKDVIRMTPDERLSAAEHALDANANGMSNAPQPVCPFLSSIKPGALCTKLGGICSMRQYSATTPVEAIDSQPTTLCPNRFLEFREDETLFGYIARELFGVESGAKVIKEIPFLEKENVDGSGRSAKAGRIDWIVIPKPPMSEVGELPWIAIETQGVYFSGDAMWADILSYQLDPSAVQYPVGRRRPDYRSSGAKRLAPQLDAKSPVMNRWGRKVVVVVDQAFFAEMGSLAVTTDFDNAEIVWVVLRYSDDMSLQVDALHFAELISSIGALQAAKPVNKQVFEADLRLALTLKKSGKVFDA